MSPPQIEEYVRRRLRYWQFKFGDPSAFCIEQAVDRVAAAAARGRADFAAHAHCGSLSAGPQFDLELDVDRIGERRYLGDRQIRRRHFDIRSRLAFTQ